MITQLRYTIAPAYVEHVMAVKNKVEVEGLRRAYLRDGAAFVSLKVTLNVICYDRWD
jgi:Xaa-Pro aminopeptidase